MKIFQSALLAVLVLLGSCSKEEPLPTEKELVQAKLIGTYDMTCLTYSWQMTFDSTQSTIYFDSTYYNENWVIEKAKDSTNIMVNDTLLTSFELNRYYEVYGFSSRTLLLDFFAPDSIVAYRKLGGGLGGGLNVECRGRKRIE
jgi:hypothetical protein